MGLREDIPAKSVGMERRRLPPDSSAGTIKITHPDRLIWPALGIRKIDLVRYFEQVGEWFLPHVAGRPLARALPRRRGKSAPSATSTWASPGDVLTFKRLRSSKGCYIYVNRLRGVISAVQNGAVEFHLGRHSAGGAAPGPHHLDLDPDPGLPPGDGRRDPHALVEGLNLRCFLKTTGGKGCTSSSDRAAQHVGRVKAFAESIAGFLVRAEPGRCTRRSPSRAAAARSSSITCATPRPRARWPPRLAPGRARTSPRLLDWDELDSTDIRGAFTVLNIAQRLRSIKVDPWAGYDSVRQRIPDSMRNACAEKGVRTPILKRVATLF